MKVELIAYTQPVNGENPMDVVEEAASVCYDSEPTKTHAIAKACKRSGHLSVWEHISFTFHVTGVSRALLAQLTRHRLASYSVRSQRYCNESEFEYVNPFERYSTESIEFESAMSELSWQYSSLKELGVKNEDARMILPNACCTEIYFTMNARALIEASYLRLCTRAQKEIRTMFQEMKKEVAKVCPEVAECMVPKCEQNPEYSFCTEEKSCGRHKKLSELITGESHG